MANTKAVFLKKMNFRLGAMEKQSRRETVQRYEEILNERIAAGTSESFAVTCLGDINTLCSQLLDKAGCSTLRPRLCAFFRRCSYVFCIFAKYFLCGLLAGLAAALLFCSFLFLRDVFLHYIPSGALFASNMMGGLFQVGMLACTVSLSLLMWVFAALCAKGIKELIYSNKKYIAALKNAHADTIIVQREETL